MDDFVESTWKRSVLPWGEKTLRFRLIRSELKVFFPMEELGVASQEGKTIVCKCGISVWMIGLNQLGGGSFYPVERKL